MKKIIAIALTLIMVFAMSTTAFAATEATLTDTTTSANADIIARYTSSSDAYVVISVDVTFGELSFVAAQPQSAWNPETHTYDGSATGTQWIATGNTVTVTNHSNRAVDVEVGAEITHSTEITATFDKAATTMLLTAVGTTVEEAPSETWTLTLSGSALAANLGGSDTAIGSVTVTIAPVLS